jgi:hypothetical protein
MIKINNDLKPSDLNNKLQRLWQLSAEKIHLIEKNYDNSKGSPVFTVKGNYTTRGRTEWTQGFQYGSAILQYDATGEKELLEYGREKTVEVMAPHISHIGVHDHGFNNVSTYGNLLRLMHEGKTGFNEWEKNFYEVALKISGAVQTTRWTVIKDGGFNSSSLTDSKYSSSSAKPPNPGAPSPNNSWWTVHPYYTDALRLFAGKWKFAMRPTMVSLLTLLLLAGSHARAQVPGPFDPTDLKVRVLNIDGVMYELLLPPNAKMLAVSVTVTFAPGTTAAEGSETTPVSVPL